MMPSSEDDNAGSTVATSQRVLQAEKSGGDIIEALTEDTRELLLLLETLKTHEAESNVVSLDSARKAAGAAG